MKPTTMAALTALALASPAAAHDYNGDLFCAVKDAQGRTTGWSFDNNTWNSDGSLGTMVETGVYKAGGKTVANGPGNRPIWIIFYNKAGGVTLKWRQDPSWLIGMDTATNRSGWTNATAHLFHNSVEVARGSCARASPQTVNSVGDQGNE